MLITNSDTLQRVVQADLNLQPRSRTCWTARLLSAFQGLRGRELYVQAVQTGRAIPMQEFTADLKHRMRGVWRDAGLVDTRTRTTTNWPLIILAPFQQNYKDISHTFRCTFFFLGWCYSYGPQQGPDRQQKKEERGLKQRRKQKEAAQGDPEPKKGNQEKEKKSSRVQS